MESENSKSEKPNTEISIVETPREVSAVTVGRMLGLATSTELNLLEDKLDLLLTKINTLTARFEKLSAQTANFPSTADIDRIEVAVGGLRNALKEVGWKVGDSLVPGAEEPQKKPARPNVFVGKGTTGE